MTTASGLTDPFGILRTGSKILMGDGVRLVLAKGEDASAKWALLFPLGETKHRKDFPGGKIQFTAEFCRSLVRNWEAEGKPERALNYFHRGASVPGDVTPIDGKVAAGWMTGLVFDESGKGPDRKDGPGVYILPKWNERARGYILNDELRYLSPEFAVDATSKATGKPQGPTLFGAALLNDPFLTELPAVAASESPESPNMDKKLVCAAMGLPETATDEQVNQACQKMAEARQKMQGAKQGAPAPEAGKPAATMSEDVCALSEAHVAASAKLAALEPEVAKLTEAITAKDAEIAKLKGDTKAAEVKAFLDKQVTEFRCTPAARADFEKLAMAHGLDCIRFVEKLPQVKAPGEVGIPGSPGGETNKLKESQARWDAQIAANEKSGLKGLAAFDAAKTALSADYELLFGSEAINAALAARPE